MRARSVYEFSNSCHTLFETKQLHALLITTNPSHHSSLPTKLLRLYATNNDVLSARLLFDKTPHKSVYMWNSMIRAYAQRQEFYTAFSLFTQMRSSDVKPDNYTFACILRACSGKHDLARARMMHGSVISSGLGSDCVANSALVSAYSKLGLLDDAGYVFEGMHERDLVLWNSMISCYGYFGYWQKGLEMFHAMRESDENPDGYSLVGLISCFWDPILLQIGRAIHGYSLKGGHDTSAHVRSVLMSMYSRCKCLDSACRLFRSFSKPDLVIWSALITGFSQAGQCKEALTLFREMCASGKRPDPVLIAAVLSACASSATVGPGKEIHGYVFRLGIDLDFAVSCALIDTYAKCGFAQLGFQVFELMPERNLITYNTVISGLGCHGLGHKVIQVFEDMLFEGFKPDKATFSALLGACCHAGLIKDGCTFFRRMEGEFGIEAEIEHYVYMVKLLGMDGQLQEAYGLIQTMPMPPDSGVWGALLWGCSVHGDSKLGEIAAHTLFEIDPGKIAYRIMLANIYAAEGKWGDVKNMRDEMMEEGLQKIPGFSWIGDCRV